MSNYADDVYIYYEALHIRSQKNVPDVLLFNNPSKEALFFRLLLGTINIGIKFDPSLIIKQRINYAILGTKDVLRLSSKSINDSQIDVLKNKTDFKTYFRRNRNNTEIFDNLLFEFANFFYQKHYGAHIAAFVHLYRSIEYISYTFPLVFAAKSKSYKGTYKALKSFFSEEQKSELKFFRIFQNSLIDKSILKLQVTFDFCAPTSDINDECSVIIKSLCNGIIYTENGGSISIAYNDFFDLIVNLRNRYFHMLNGIGNSIMSKKICMDYFFSTFNEHVANWIAYTYFEITKFGLENFK